MTSPRGASTRLVAVPVRKSSLSSPMLISPGGMLAERLAEDAAALHDFEGADEEAGAHVAGLLDRDVELHLGVGGVGRVAAQILRRCLRRGRWGRPRRRKLLSHG